MAGSWELFPQVRRGGKALLRYAIAPTVKLSPSPAPHPHLLIVFTGAHHEQLCGARPARCVTCEGGEGRGGCPSGGVSPSTFGLCRPPPVVPWHMAHALADSISCHPSQWHTLWAWPFYFQVLLKSSVSPRHGPQRFFFPGPLLPPGTWTVQGMCLGTRV